MLRLCLLAACVLSVVSHPSYKNLIPNGNSVPNPCGSGVWEAVGHYDPLHHTIDKNQFGQDFAAAGHSWTVALCNKDSDRDGMTNGQELGDPNCVWTVGATPARAASGQPGICEPVGSCGDKFTCGCHGHQCVAGK